jgi:hypothetical protein
VTDRQFLRVLMRLITDEKVVSAGGGSVVSTHGCFLIRRTCAATSVSHAAQRATARRSLGPRGDYDCGAVGDDL